MVPFRVPLKTTEPEAPPKSTAPPSQSESVAHVPCSPYRRSREESVLVTIVVLHANL